MQITFEISGEKEKNTSLVLSNDDYDNFNFVSIIIEGKEYTVSVEDLFRAIETFNNIRLEHKGE